MTYKLKRHHLTNWDMYDTNERASMHDEQDIHISERSSVPSADELSRSPKSDHRHFTPPLPPVLAKQPHTLVYPYNQLPENGIPWGVQARAARKEEKRMRKNVRRAPPGQGSLAPIPEPKAADMNDDYYSYRTYFQAKNPDWYMRHQQYPNGELIPYDSFDPSKYTNPPAPPTSSKKSHRRHRRHRKSRRDSPINEDNPENAYQQSFSLKQEGPPPANRDPALEDGDSHTSKDPSKHHHHHHHHHHSPGHQQPNEFVDKEFRVADVSFKRSDRSPFFQPIKNSFPVSPPTSIYNQASYLPPITPYYYYRPIPVDYYVASATPTVYKPNPRTDFYDRYLNRIITKH